MRRRDTMGLIGLILFVVGIGGGVELTLLAQSQAYRDLMEAGGNADPSMFAEAIQEATVFVKLGIPVGMIGFVLMAVALRGYVIGVRRSM